MTRSEVIKVFFFKSVLPVTVALILYCIFKSACIAVLRDRAEGVVLIELVQHLVNLFKARRDLRNTLLLFLGLVGLLHGKVLFH